MRFHRLQNVQIALDYLKRRQVKLVNIRNDDITDGNPKLTLGLIWTIILHFQISEIHVTGESEDMTAKERLLLWSKQMTDGYVGVRCDNFTTSWRDGRLFNAIIHKYRPDLIDMSRVSTQTNRSNLENAFCVAEQLGVARLLDPEDVDVQAPDEKSVITYVSTLYDAFPKVPAGVDGISPNDVDIKWVEYQNMIKYLSQWIKHNVAMMSDRSFPNNPVELKALYTQYLQFKENEIPLKENEKTKIKNLYKMLEVWIEFGRIHLPPGHHPNDVEKEWGKLIVAMLEREKCLRPEVERLEMLQQIANRVQRDCVNGDDKLTLARIALQSDAKRLESGIQFLHEAEIAGYLLECENILRQQVMDIQLLLDGKFPFADQLVQRVSKLRDDLLSLRAECSSVYSKGRTLTTEQTKIMISGITQSLNSGFSQNFGTNLTPALTPAITPGGLSTPGSTFTSSLTPSLTPALTPGLQPSSVQSYMGSGGVMDPGSLRQLKHMQIRKPLQKSSLADSNMTEEEVNMKYVQDLLVWVEEMQVQLDRSEWGSDLPSVETHLETHKSVQRAIEEFQISLKDARLSEIQMTIPLKLTYSDKLNKLEKQYERLLSCSRERQSNLESLYDFVSHATQELIWLNEKEEEEVAFDWSDRNSNVSKKRDYHAELMMELEEKEEAIKSVQDKAERLMFKNHPAKITIEAYRAAMQTQWSWILQLCSCVEQHLKENAVYFEFFSDAKESMDYLRNLQESIQRKYSCDRSSSLHRLEDLIQESMDEKEQLLQYRSTVAGLVGRAKNIVQLRPRNPESPVRSSLPVKAICDYRQIEITIYKDDECILANNSHRAKWKVINPAGNEAMVPSVCFTVPPPNKEAVEKATRTEQLYQDVLALWHHSHINMKSVVSWHYLMADIRAIRNWNVASIKTMLPGEHQQVLSNLQSHFDEFLDDSKESEVFTLADRTQLERDVAACKEYYQELLRSAEREEHEELVYNNYISEIRNFRMHLEAHEEHLIRQIRTPLERDDLEQSLQRITEHGRKTAELNKLKEDLDVMKEKCELFLRQAAVSPSVPTLSSELTVLIQSMSQVYSMSSIYMDKLKTVSLVVKHSQSAEALVKFYESKLYVEDAMNSDVKSIETVISTLKQWRTEIDEKQEVFHDMEDELKRARLISDRMFKAHNERDFDLDWHKEKADQLSERWQNIHSQIDSRLRDLDGINKSLKNYRDTYSCLDEWVREMEAAQLKAQENKPEDSKALAELLNKQKVLVAEIEQKQSRIDECQKYSEQYSSAIKDYELQLMTFSAMVDSQHKSPLKKRRMQSSSDAIQQEFMDLRTRYTALVTLMTQYVKFASETLKRTEDEENRKTFEQGENIKRKECMELQKSACEVEISQLKQRIHEQEAMLAERQARLEKLNGEVEMQQKTIDDLSFQKSHLEHDVHQFRTKLEIAFKDKAAGEQELIHTKLLIEQAEAKWSLAQSKLEDLKKQSPELQRKTNPETDTEENVQSQVQAEANDHSQLIIESPARVEDDNMRGHVLQQKLEELDLVHRRADMAEEKAQSYKKLLDDSNNRLKKLQVDMETERINTRQKSDEFQQETLNLKKAVDDLQEEIKSLQRAKSSLEQTTFFQSTEVEGLKEQLKVTQGELHKKVFTDQDNIYKINNLEEEVSSKQAVIDQLKFKCSELTMINVSSVSDIRDLQIQTESLGKEKSLYEKKVRSLKSEIESWKQMLETAEEENTSFKKAEQALKLKYKNLEAEVESKELVASQLQRKVEELKQVNTEVEMNLKNVKDNLDLMTVEIDSKDQQIEIFKCQVEATKSQFRIIEEELNKKSQSVHELQMKLQDYSEELRKMTELKHKTETRSSDMANYGKEITSLKLEQNFLTAERDLVNQKVNRQDAEINELNLMLKKTNAELQKESADNQKHINKIKALEKELFNHKHSIKDLNSSSEKVTENLKQEINALQNDKKAAERKVENLNVRLSELSSSLLKTKDELAKETKDRQVKESKILQLESELQKNKVNIKEAITNPDKFQSNLQHENTILNREKAEALEKNTSLELEIRMLKQNLKSSETEVEQKQRENSVVQLKSQQMEEQLDKCKKMLDELKSKLQLQKDGYERQLMLVQKEIEKKLILLQSQISNDNETSKPNSLSAELAEMLNKYLKQEVLHQTTVESKQQTDQPLQVQFKIDKLQQDKTKLTHDLSQAKSQITQLEEERLKLSLKISALQSLCNEKSNEKTKFKPLSADSECKPTLRESEEPLTLGVGVKTENQKMNKQEVNETSRQHVKDNTAASLKTEAKGIQKTASSCEGGKCRTEDEFFKMKMSSEMTTVEKENSLDDLKQDKRDKTEVNPSQILHGSTTKRALQNVSQIIPDGHMTTTTHGYMALCGQTDQGQHKTQRVTKTRIYQISETVNISEKSAADSDGKQTLIYSTPQKLTELKGGTADQIPVTSKIFDDAQYVGKPTAIAGVYVESSKKKITFLEAAEKGFLAKTYAFEFLEAQVATGSLTDLATGQTLSVAEALERGVIETGMSDKLIEAEKAVRGYIHAGKKLSVFQAMEERLLDRYRGKKILEVQVSTGGLINPGVGVTVSASNAVDQGLLNKETLKSLYDPVSNPKGFHNPDTGQKAYYCEILKKCVYDIDGGVFLFPFGERRLTDTSPTSSHRMSVVSSSRGIEMSTYEAFKAKHVDKRMYLFLAQQESEWQEKSVVDTSGSPLHIITDVKSGRQLCLESALNQRFLEASELDSYCSGRLSIYELADLIFSRMVVIEDVNSPIAGLWDVAQRKRLSVLQGFQQGFTDRTTALRLLEAQACTGGICDPSSGDKVTISEALKRGLVDEALKQQLQQFEQAFNGIVHPSSAKTLSISQALQEKLLPKDVGFRCVEYQLLTGGLINPDTQDRVSLEEVIQSGLVDKATASVLKDEKFHTRSLTCPKTKRRITFKEALERSVFDCHTGLRLLEASKVLGSAAKSAFLYACAFNQ
uniref:plectin-like isoform X1 n=1 Tax=Solea senegalensis TaxID=28829 RepID=UPI001CD893EC|nr:plectin-like isoform X1 [Solea senegalensis]